MGKIPDRYEGKTAAELRAAAAEADRRVFESQQNSDTDGFLSQWAGGLTAQKLREQARILEQGGFDTFSGLYDASGRRLKARVVQSKHGSVWLLEDAEKRLYGRKFVPLVGGSDSKSRVQKALGLSEKAELAPAQAIVTGKGYGLSGSAWVAAIRIGDEWGQDAKPAPEQTP